MAGVFLRQGFSHDLTYLGSQLAPTSPIELLSTGIINGTLSESQFVEQNSHGQQALAQLDSLSVHQYPVCKMGLIYTHLKISSMQSDATYI